MQTNRQKDCFMPGTCTAAKGRGRKGVINFKNIVEVGLLGCTAPFFSSINLSGHLLANTFQD
jgi:hypothetical protein